MARQAFALSRADVGSALEIGVGIGRPPSKRLTQCQQMAFGLTHDFDEDSTLSPALAAKATHGLLEVAHEHLALGSQHPNLGWTGYDLCDVMDDLEDFFWAL